MINFDRVADIYDSTRSVPADVLERVADRIVATTQADLTTEFLEPGIGTGRIAIPLIRRGYRYTGVDVSQQMMDRLRAKAENAPNLKLVEGDVTELPLPDASIDVVITVHLLHLVPEWQKALEEIQRVLKPAGFVVQGRESGVPGDPVEEILHQWRRLVVENGAALRPQFASETGTLGCLNERGFRTTQYRVADWIDQFPPIDLIDALHQRTFSQTWDVPNDVLDVVHEKLVAWATDQFGDVNRTVESREEFMLTVSWRG